MRLFHSTRALRNWKKTLHDFNIALTKFSSNFRLCSSNLASSKEDANVFVVNFQCCHFTAAPFRLYSLQSRCLSASQRLVSAFPKKKEGGEVGEGASLNVEGSPRFLSNRLLFIFYFERRLFVFAVLRGFVFFPFCSTTHSLLCCLGCQTWR